MKLLSLNKIIFTFYILFIFSSALHSEEGVDIWMKENLNKKNNSTISEKTILPKPPMK